MYGFCRLWLLNSLHTILFCIWLLKLIPKTLSLFFSSCYLSRAEAIKKANGTLFTEEVITLLIIRTIVFFYLLILLVHISF